MDRLSRLLSAALLLAACLLPAAHAAEADEFRLFLRADITIEPDGSLSRLEWAKAGEIPAAVRARLDERVRSWQFEPGAIDGRPAVTETTLRLRVLAEPVGEVLALRVESAETGAAISQMQPPDFPFDALRAGAEAAVLAILEVDANGTHRMAVAGYEGGKRWRKGFVGAVEKMLRETKVRHERIGGLPVAARFSIPVDFCVGAIPVPCEPHAWPEATGTSTLPTTAPGLPQPVGSVARLVTDVRASAI